MSYASSAVPVGIPDLRPAVGTLRAAVQLLGTAVQTVGFAAVAWLLLAGPGFLQ